MARPCVGDVLPGYERGDFRKCVRVAWGEFGSLRFWLGRDRNVLVVLGPGIIKKTYLLVGLKVSLICLHANPRFFYHGHNSPICMMNAKLSQHRFWPCHENRPIKTIQTIPLSVKLTSHYCGLRLILVYPNPQ